MKITSASFTQGRGRPFVTANVELDLAEFQAADSSEMSGPQRDVILEQIAAHDQTADYQRANRRS